MQHARLALGSTPFRQPAGDAGPQVFRFHQKSPGHRAFLLLSLFENRQGPGLDAFAKRLGVGMVGEMLLELVVDLASPGKFAGLDAKFAEPNQKLACVFPKRIVEAGTSQPKK